VKQFVAGRLVIPIYFPVLDLGEDALKKVRSEINNHTISVIEGDISTWSGNTYPLIARRCFIEWTDVVTQDDVI